MSPVAAERASADSAPAPWPDDPPAGWVDDPPGDTEPPAVAEAVVELDEDPHPASSAAPINAHANEDFWIESMRASVPESA
jgi:hypothetical protein